MASDRSRRGAVPPEAPGGGDLPPRAVIGAEALAALAVPARLALLNHLLVAGPRTASQCAPVVGESASNCSWHLRALEKAGLVARAPQAGDARTRPWQATAVGFRLGGEAATPAEQVARTVLSGLIADHADDLYRRYLAGQDAVPEQWREAAGDSGYGLRITADELHDLLERVDALIRPYVAPIRAQAPEGAEIVHVTLRAFLDPHLHAAIAP